MVRENPEVAAFDADVAAPPKRGGGDAEEMRPNPMGAPICIDFNDDDDFRDEYEDEAEEAEEEEETRYEDITRVEVEVEGDGDGDGDGGDFLSALDARGGSFEEDDETRGGEWTTFGAAGASSEDGSDSEFDDDDDELYLTDADDALTLSTAQQEKGASVKSAKYLQTCVRVQDCPPLNFPEIAVIGRSNVGKSSLVNLLTGRKDVAKTSKNPGKTQTINHFEMITGDGKWYLVDLPGYGFANAPERLRKKWALFTREYLLERENLLAVMLLIDSTVEPQRLDLECLEFLGENDIPVSIVFTKVDKKRKVKSGKRAKPEENVEAFCREVSEYWEEMPPMIFTSSKTGDGKAALLNHVATLRQFFKEGEGRGK